MKKNQNINAQIYSDDNAVRGITGIVGVTLAILVFWLFGSKRSQDTVAKQSNDSNTTAVFGVKQSTNSKDSADFIGEYKKIRAQQQTNQKTY